MLSKTHLPDQKIRPFNGVANNLPGSLSKKPGWGHPILKAAKMFGRCYALDRAGDDETLASQTEWKEFGIQEKEMLKAVKKLLPEFDEVWRRYDRKTAPQKLLHNRVWYMFCERNEHGEPIKMISKEHPLRSKKLRPLREPIDRLWRRGKPVYYKELVELGF